MLAELPSRVERTVLCPLSALQREVLRLVRSRAERLAAPHSKRADGLGADEGVALSFQNIVMQLRKLCNHPFLVLEDLKSIPGITLIIHALTRHAYRSLTVHY